MTKQEKIIEKLLNRPLSLKYYEIENDKGYKVIYVKSRFIDNRIFRKHKLERILQNDL